jgi:hypothetical protein
VPTLPVAPVMTIRIVWDYPAGAAVSPPPATNRTTPFCRTR